MNLMHRAPAWLLVASLVATVAPVAAQIQPGRVYTGGERVSDPSGLAVTLPDGWRGSLSPDGEAFVLESILGGGYIFVTGDQANEAQARQQLGEAMELGGGVRLTPVGDVREVASGHLTSDFAVMGAASDFVARVDVRLTPAGLGVAFILLSPPGAVDSHLESMRALAFSLGAGDQSAQSSPTSSASTSSGNDEWEPFLRGLYLAHYFTRTGYTESTELWLCADGTFYYNDQGGGFGGGASGAFQGLGNGRWSASGAGQTGTLRLDWSGGERSEWALEYDYEQNRVFVNGERMLRGENERCQ